MGNADEAYAKSARSSMAAKDVAFAQVCLAAAGITA